MTPPEPLLQIRGLRTHFFTESGVAKAVDGSVDACKTRFRRADECVIADGDTDIALVHVAAGIAGIDVAAAALETLPLVRRSEIGRLAARRPRRRAAVRLRFPAAGVVVTAAPEDVVVEPVPRDRTEQTAKQA